VFHSQQTVFGNDTKKHIPSASRIELGQRLAQGQMESNTGLSSHQTRFDCHPSACEPGYTTEVLGLHVLAALQQIPDSLWKNQSRANVRPQGQTFSHQISLGLVTSAAWRRLPMPSSLTWRLMNLTKLINLYLRRLAKDQGMDVPLVGTTIQLTKNLQSRLHKDKNNRGTSYITGLGSWSGGETFMEDPSGPEVVVDAANAQVRGRKESIKEKVIQFDGTKVHGTCPFEGERYAIILYSLGTQVY
jgi:hypothetical protein